ncbi:glycosyltransferase family 39 protein [Candidatus Roizmanbacteria bacterium]|nr:glycosyltransferase family 39 protein [Candidatus Roizmanbacteria bacterium]
MHLKKFIDTYRIVIGSCVLISIVYFLSRIINLTDLPIFTDEAIYIRWAQIGSYDAAWRFISLTDGKQPLFVWFMMATVRMFDDPLFAGRIVSVGAGFCTMVGMWFLGWQLFKNYRIGLFASLLYLISPFSLMYDRMALMDSLVAMFSVWSLSGAVILVKTLRLDVAILLGMCLGGAVLTKTSGFLNLYLLPVTGVLFSLKEKPLARRFFRWIGLAMVAVILSQIYYSILRLSPWFHMIGIKDTTFVWTIPETIPRPFRFLIGNLNGELDWLITYLTLPIVMLITFSLASIRSSTREKILLFLWFFIPLIGLAIFGKVLYPRFVLFMSMPLLVLAAWSLDWILSRIKSTSVKIAVIVCFLIYPLYVDSKILFSIVTAPIPQSDLGQYVNDWPSGWGIREVVEVLKKEAHDGQIVVFTEGNFGLLPAGIEIYLVGNHNIHIVGLWPPPATYTEEMVQAVKTLPTFYISNQFEYPPQEWNVEEVVAYPKGNHPRRTLRLYRLHAVGSDLP